MELDIIDTKEFENEFKEFMDIIVFHFLEEVSKDKTAIDELNNLLLTQHEKIKLKEKENK